jgi:hypothetical protein
MLPDQVQKRSLKMANENVAHEAQVGDLDDARNKLCEATALVNLTEWIERAKYLCGHIANAASMDKNLAMALQSNGVAYLNADWSTEQSDALVHLLGLQRDLMDTACENISKVFQNV